MNQMKRVAIPVLVLMLVAAARGQTVKITVPAEAKERKFVFVQQKVSEVAAPFALKADGANIPVQAEKTEGGYLAGFLLREIPANKEIVLELSHADQEPAAAVKVSEVEKGVLAVASPTRQITRYTFGAKAEQLKHPYFYPITVSGVPVTRGHPIEDKPNEAKDHPHHVSVWFAHGDVNGKDYWAKLPVAHKRIVKMESGPVYARIVAENAWGDDLIETQDVRLFDAGEETLMDWSITLTAPAGKEAKLGKTKEGSFAVRVCTELTSPDPGKPTQAGRGNGKMTDSDGNEGEKAIRNETAPRRPKNAAWVDYAGTVGGKSVGVAMMNHPASWRHATDWHVRQYGLFAANAWMLQGEHTLKPGEAVTLKYRLYFHAGNPTEAKVPAVFAGYSIKL